MKRTIRLLAMVLCVALCLTFVPASAFAVSNLTPSEVTSKMDSLKATYPDGSAFNIEFGGGRECYGFARWVANKVFGSYPRNCNPYYDGYIDSNGWKLFKNPSNSLAIEPGDIIEVRNTGTSDHTAIVYTSNNGVLTFAEAWGGSGNTVHWGIGYCSYRGSSISAIKQSYGSCDLYVWKRPGALYSEEGFSFSTYAYEHSTYEIIKATNLKSAPYSSSDNKDNIYLNVGDTIAVRELVQNKYNNIWLKTSNGGYIYSGYAVENGSLVKKDTMHAKLKSNDAEVWITDPVLPSGNIVADANFRAHGFNIGGTVHCNNSIKRITASISNSNVPDSTVTFSNYTTVSHNIYSSNLNYNLRFNDLQPGTYRFYLNVTYYSDRLQKEVTAMPKECISTFTVVNPGHTTHSWSSSTIIPPTCMSGGYTRFYCSGCSAYEDRNPTPALGHDYVETRQIEASCLVDGQVQHTCSRCGDIETEVIPAPGHSFSAPVRFEADCTNLGGTIQECSACHETVTELDPPTWSEWSTEYPEGIPEDQIETGAELRHYTRETIVINRGETPPAGSTYLSSNSGWTDYGAWGNWQTDSISANDATQVETRTQYAYYYYLCPNCGKHQHGYGQCWSWSGGGCGATTYSDNFVIHWSTTPFSSVSFKEWNGTGKYYATVDGQTVFRWDNNSHTRTQYRSCTRTLLDQEVYELAPQWSEWNVYAEGTAPTGENVFVETRSVYRYYAIPGEHMWDEGTVSTTPTCTHEGVRTYTCTVCNQAKTESIAVVPHSYKNEVVAPACTKGGFTKHTCTECGYYFEDTVTDPTDHSWVNEVIIRPATCGITGYSKFSCDACGETKIEETPALEHDYQTYKVEPTCVQNGFTKEMCVQCGDCKSEVVIQALGHSEVTVPGHAATCTSAGATNEVRCERCDEVLEASVPIAPLGHSYTEIVVKPTPTEDGYTLHTCEECGDSFIDNPVPYDEPNGFKVVVETKKARAGQTVDLKIMLEENPGIYGMDIKLVYDKALLTLTEVVNGTVFNDAELQPSENPAEPSDILSYEADNLSSNITANGLLATVKFMLNDNAVVDTSIPVSITYEPGSVVNANLDDIKLSPVPGGVKVTDIIYGDLFEDGAVNKKDSIQLRRFLAGWNVQIDMDAADVFYDGAVNKKDSIQLRRYLAGWNVTLGG